MSAKVQNAIIDIFMDEMLQKLGLSIEEFNYDTDWNNLMLVVEKIENLVEPGRKIEKPYYVSIRRSTCIIIDGNNGNRGIPIAHYIVDSKHKSVWFAVTKFIQQYNLKNLL